MLLHANEYKRLKALIQLEKETGKRQNITHLDMMDLAETEKMIKSSPSMRETYLDETPTQIKHIANKQGDNVSSEAITKAYHDTNKAIVEKYASADVSNAPGLYQNDGVYLKSKVIADATGIANGTIRSLASRNILKKNANSEISVKSLAEYVSSQVNERWKEYAKMKAAQDVLNQS